MTISFDPPPSPFNWSHYRVVTATLRAGLDALTVYQIGLQTNPPVAANGTFSFPSVSVRVSLSRHASWVVAGRQTQALLNHEQLHYRIAALVGRELGAEATALTASSAAALLGAGTRLHTAKLQRARAIEEAYDLATQHSRSTTQQDVWAHRVDGWERNNFTITWP
jgi:hypothetical protein